MLDTVRHLIIGNPLPTSAASHERLSKVQALAVLSSDALSSVAYAIEEVLMVLVAVGTAAAGGPFIGSAIAVLMVIVAGSYYQTIHAYSDGRRLLHRSPREPGVSASLVAGAVSAHRLPPGPSP